MTHEVTGRHPAQALRRCATTPEDSLSASLPENEGMSATRTRYSIVTSIRRSAAMTHGVTDRHPAHTLRRCATMPKESLSAPGERGDVRNADTLSVNFYLCTINRKLRETLRIVKKKDRDGELLC